MADEHEPWRVRDRFQKRARVLRKIAELIHEAADAGMYGAAKALESAADSAQGDIAARAVEEIEGTA